MEFMKTSKSEEVVFGKGFVPMLTVFFAATDEETRHFSNLKESGKRIHLIIDPTGTVSLNGEDMQSFKESLTGEPMPQLLLAEGPRPGESAPEPISARRPRWRPAYQLAAGSLIVTLALGLFILAISDRALWRETNGTGIGTVIAEKDSIVSVLAKQDQGLVPVPGASVKRERPQRLAHNQRNGADPDALLLKEDAAWRVLQR
jgi:hypothetical protein